MGKSRNCPERGFLGLLGAFWAMPPAFTRSPFRFPRSRVMATPADSCCEISKFCLKEWRPFKYEVSLGFQNLSGDFVLQTRHPNIAGPSHSSFCSFNVSKWQTFNGQSCDSKSQASKRRVTLTITGAWAWRGHTTWWEFRPRKKKFSPPPQIPRKHPPSPSPPRPHPPGRPPRPGIFN